MKNTLTHIVNYEKTIFDKKKQFEKVRHGVCQLRKTLEYLKIQERLSSENLTEYFLKLRNIFTFFSSLKDIIQAKSKTNH